MSSISVTATRLTVGFPGLTVHISSDWTDLIQVLARRLQRLKEAVDGTPVLNINYQRAEDPSEVIARPDGPSRPVYETPRGQIEYFPDTDELFLEYGEEARLLIRAARAEAVVAFRPSDESLWLTSHPLFTLALVEMLKRRRLYNLHAAGVATSGKSMLIAGTSGVGKSTLTLALIRRGLDFLGDDMTCLSSDGSRVLAFPDEIDVTSQTLAMFSGLHGMSRPGWNKLQVQHGLDGGPTVAWESEPVLLVFPAIAGTRESRLMPISANEALLELAPNVILTERNSSQEHLAAITALVKGSSCFRLDAGTDVDAASSLLHAALVRAERR